MGASTWFAVAELIVGALMFAAGAWQYINAGPLPGLLGQSLRKDDRLDHLTPRRWQLSGAAQGLFGLGFLLFGGAVLVRGRVDESGLGAIRSGGMVAWIIAIGLLVVVLRRYRRRA